MLLLLLLFDVGTASGKELLLLLLLLLFLLQLQLLLYELFFNIFKGGKLPTFYICIDLFYEFSFQLPLLTRYRSYPPAVWFIVGNEFCERFSYYGMKAVLALYLKNRLGFGEDSATVLYHCFTLLCYFTPFVGAALADQVRERFF